MTTSRWKKLFELAKIVQAARDRASRRIRRGHKSSEKRRSTWEPRTLLLADEPAIREYRLFIARIPKGQETEVYECWGIAALNDADAARQARSILNKRELFGITYTQLTPLSANIKIDE